MVGAWIERDVVAATGRDAAGFLQGQLSQDVAALAVGSWAWSLLLDPSGKVTAWLRVHRTGEETFLLDVTAGWGEIVVARLNRFKIRVECELTEYGSWQMLSLRSDSPVAEDAVVPDGAAPAAGATAGVVGYDLVGEEGTIDCPDGVVIDPDAIEEHRIAHGVPEMGAELDDSVIPGEMGAWFVAESVSWTKGCYTGQELVARIDSRGNNTPRRLRSVVLSAPASPGDALVDEDGAEVGELTSVFGNLGLARVKRSVEPPATVTVAGASAQVLDAKLNLSGPTATATTP